MNYKTLRAGTWRGIRNSFAGGTSMQTIEALMTSCQRAYMDTARYLDELRRESMTAKGEVSNVVFTAEEWSRAK